MDFLTWYNHYKKYNFLTQIRMKSFVSVFVFNALIFLLLGSERIHDLDIIPDVINY
jgi:hypothetical protein